MMSMKKILAALLTVMMVLTAADCSLSGMKINSGMKNYLVEGLLEIANGHFFKGIRKMMKRVK